MRLFILGLWLLSLPVFADTVSFRNDREGDTYYSSRSHKRAMNGAVKKLGESAIVDAFNDVLKETQKNNLCSFALNQSLLQKLKHQNPKFKEYEGALFYLRSQNQLDDAAVRILINAHETITTKVYAKNEDQLHLPSDALTHEIIPIIKSFEGRFLRNNCFDDAYKSLYGEIRNVFDKVTSRQLEALFYEAYIQNHIDEDLYIRLEQARKNELELKGLTLKAYYQKVSSLRNQYPLRDTEEKSSYVTQKVSKMKLSRRQYLLENYTDMQIVFMGNIIKKLRTRLESPKAEILIYDRNEGVETILLEPMERFRLAIKLLRKEMAYLSLNTFFYGGSPSYLDLMTAAFELGIIPASELDELVSIEEIWNPKKTFWQKARVWVTTFGTVATILIPPPYGFIPALALVVIEYTAGNEKNANEEDPTSLF